MILFDLLFFENTSYIALFEFAYIKKYEINALPANGRVMQ
jgi:hypothetical protein